MKRTRPASAGLARTRAKAQGGSHSELGLRYETTHTDELVIALRQGELLTLGDDARRRHLHLIGATGAGKTTIIKNLITQDLAAGRGVGLIDPLGHLADAVLGLVPPSRTHQVVHINAADLERPAGFNPLQRAHPDRHASIADDVVSAFVHIWGKTAVGERSQQVLRNSVRALLSAETATLLCIPKLLTDTSYRERIVRTITDPVVLTYWRQQFAQYDDTWRNQVISPVLNKLDALLSAPALRNMLGQVRSTVDFRRVIDSGQILIIDLKKGLLGEHNAHVLGALLVSALGQAAFGRQDVPQDQRRPWYLYADEFQDYSSAAFHRMLSQGRNCAIALTVGHQYLRQMDNELRDAVLGNTANVISFRIGAEDSPTLAAHLGLPELVEYTGMGSNLVGPETLLAQLPNFQAYARLLVGDAPSNALHLEMLPDPHPINNTPHRIVTFSRQRYGRDRLGVENKIARFLETK